VAGVAAEPFRRVPHPASGTRGSPGPVPPGGGWPEDPATPRTPVAQDAEGVLKLAAAAGDFSELAARQSVCRACPRLVSWRERVATDKRRAFADQTYWGGRCPAGATVSRGCSLLGSRPQRAEATAPAGSSRATAAAIGCLRRCTGSAWR
jgi:hypothetical protein